MRMKQIVTYVSLTVVLAAAPALGQWASVNPAQQALAEYQSWLQNADIQLRMRTNGLPPIMQLQASMTAIECELAQWGGFLQQYFPAVYAQRCAVLQQKRGLYAQMVAGGGFAPSVSSGVNFGQVEQWRQARRQARMDYTRDYWRRRTESRLRSTSGYR